MIQTDLAPDGATGRPHQVRQEPVRAMVADLLGREFTLLQATLFSPVSGSASRGLSDPPN